MPKTVKATKKRKQDAANFKTYIARARTRGACGGAREGAGGRGVLYDIDFGPRCAARRSGRSVGGSCGVPGADAHGACHDCRAGEPVDGGLVEVLSTWFASCGRCCARSTRS